jgi:hypothetical protein
MGELAVIVEVEGALEPDNVEDAVFAAITCCCSAVI